MNSSSKFCLEPPLFCSHPSQIFGSLRSRQFRSWWKQQPGKSLAPIQTKHAHPEKIEIFSDAECTTHESNKSKLDVIVILKIFLTTDKLCTSCICDCFKWQGEIVFVFCG